jgi:hypothetical protein
MKSFAMDFNHGGAVSVGNQRAAPFSDRVTAFIDAALMAENEKQPPRKYVGASAIGNKCLRQTQLGFIHNLQLEKAPVPVRFEGRTLRIFSHGHMIEAMVGLWLLKAGFDIDFIVPGTEDDPQQIGWVDHDGLYKGHVDGKVKSGPIDMDYPCIWECKGLNMANWQKVRKNGVTREKPVYAAQVAVNQENLDIKSPTFFTTFSKNDCSLFHELVPFDQTLAKEMNDNALMIINNTKMGRLMPAIATYSDYYVCKMCSWHGFCWGRKKQNDSRQL